MSFYKWYVKAYAASNDLYDSAEFKSQIGNWLTPAFVANYRQILANTESDPVLYSQDYQSSWLTTVNADVSGRSATTTAVVVTLGSGSQKNTTKCTDCESKR